MNVWFISDTHFGLKNNSKVWEEQFKDCFDKFLYPLFDEKVQRGDVLIHCGDVFDNRQTVGLSTLNFAMSVFERLGDFFSQIIVICGNHDAYENNSNDISSTDCLKYIPNVRVIKTPQKISVGNRTIGFVPWINDSENLTAELHKMAGVNMVVCHADFNGITMNASGTKSESDVKVENVGLGCRIYSGHIHHRQKYKNVCYIGSPYQMSQNDRENDRGVLCVSEDGVETFYKNEISPEFKRVQYDDVKELTLYEFKEFCKNKYMEITVDSDLLSKFCFHKIYAYTNNCKEIKNITFIPEKSKLEVVSQKVNMSECVSIEDMLDRYVDTVLDYDDKVKANIKKISKKLIRNGQ